MKTSWGSRASAVLAALTALSLSVALLIGPAHADDEPSPDPVATEPAPTDPSPTETVPTDPAPEPTETVPTDPAPTDPAPGDRVATVTASAEPAVFGDDATVHVTVSADGEVPTGRVTVSTGATALDEVELDDDASVDATVDSTSLRSGTHRLTVEYSGSESLDPVETTVELTVAKAPTRTVASVEGTPRRGGAATVDAVVTSSTDAVPTGSVVVRRGETVLASAETVAEESGVTAQLTVPTDDLPIGTTALTATFEPAVDDDSTSSSDRLTLDLSPAVVRLTATPPTGATYGVASKIAVATDPRASGLVMLSEDHVMVAVGVLDDGRGVVRIGRTALTPGEHHLTVAFNGSDEVEPAETTVDLTVAKAASTLAATVEPTSIRRGVAGATVRVSVTAPGVVVTDGKVAVRVGSRVIGRADVKDGVATVSLVALRRTGPRALTVRFRGTSLVGSGSTTATITVVAR